MKHSLLAAHTKSVEAGAGEEEKKTEQTQIFVLSLNAAKFLPCEKEKKTEKTKGGIKSKNNETKTRTNQPECAEEKQKKQLRPNAMQRHVCEVFRDKQWTGLSIYLYVAQDEEKKGEEEEEE